MGLIHRLQHLLTVNAVTKVIKIDGELWYVAECRRCGAELCRWFFKHGK